MNSQNERNKLLEAAFAAFALEIAFALVIVLVIALLKTAF